MPCAHPGVRTREICAHLELDRRRQDRLPDETRAVGQIGPPAFFLPLPAPEAARQPAAARTTDDISLRFGPAAFLIPGPPHSPSLESPSVPPPEPRTEE